MVQTMTALVADDHDVYRAGISQLLQSALGLTEIVQAGTFDDALDHLASKDFGLALFDLDMPGMHGPETLREVRLTYPSLKLIVISATTDASVIKVTEAIGVDRYIPKSTSLTEMMQAIRAEVAHTEAEPRGSVETEARSHTPMTPPRKGSALTSRQKDVLLCVERGLSNKEIARDLSIAPGTVKIHLAALFAYYSVRNRTELAIKARVARAEKA